MSSLESRQIMAKNILRLMERTGKDRNTVCSDLGIKYSTFSEWVNATKFPRIDKIEMMANYFGVVKSELIEDQSAPPSGATPYRPTHRIPILGRISAGLPLYAEEHIEGYTYTDLNGGAEYFALRVAGDSMNAARMNDGDLLIVRRQDIVDNGDIAVVLVGDEDATVKRFYRSGDTITLMPQSTNPQHKPQVYNARSTRIRIQGRVVRNEITY